MTDLVGSTDLADYFMPSGGMKAAHLFAVCQLPINNEEEESKGGRKEEHTERTRSVKTNLK